LSPLYEPGLQELLESNISAGRLEFNADIGKTIKNSDIVFIAVGTPTTQLGTSDLSQVDSAIQQVLSAVESEIRELQPTGNSNEQISKVDHVPAKIIVMKSTVPVGTGERFSRVLSCNEYFDLHYVSNPEFLREGQAVNDFMHPDRIVVGGDDENAIRNVAGLYNDLDAPLIFTRTTNAELIKYASNAFLATKISFVNEIANLCEEVGVKALKQLAGHNGYHFELLSAVLEVNEMQKTRPVQKLRRYLHSLSGKKICVLGLTFKPNTDDVRESVGIDVVRLLQFEGANISAFDPIGIEQAKKILSGVSFADDPYQAVENVHAVVIATDDPIYASLDWSLIKSKMAYPLIIDGRNIIDVDYQPEGLILDGVGKPVELLHSQDVAGVLSLTAAEYAADRVDRIANRRFLQRLSKKAS
ncbi:MAG: UDP-glucose/GDP-mannose dehydrogenase family protein, partial [Rubrobacteridae bacterium]|nr:UDP-glucose/GDP-mannose dehydrogenase family protein [Rubrobacteridae bacterium]